VACRRVQTFLDRQELAPRQALTFIDNIPVGTPVIEIRDGILFPFYLSKLPIFLTNTISFAGDFSWESEGLLTLRGVNLRVPRGQLVAVVGPVGSGKSTLLAAMMEQVTRVRGTVTMHGSAAFVPQQAWIQNMTLRDNVLFGSQFDEEKYNHTIQVCALEPDLKQLLAGDQVSMSDRFNFAMLMSLQTEIGERGINLSGGQKQRVSIARAVYADKDVVLLDDPLSAVDQHVGKSHVAHIIALRCDCNYF
jgi:ATP-binding cassette subfamily C (CFTR/MRP) protein 1